MKTTGSCSCRACARHGRQAMHGLLPALALILMPKCPACVAACAAAFTGLSLSTGVAAGLRTALIILCTGWLLAAAGTAARRLLHRPAPMRRIP